MDEKERLAFIMKKSKELNEKYQLKMSDSDIKTDFTIDSLTMDSISSPIRDFATEKRDFNNEMNSYISKIDQYLNLKSLLEGGRVLDKRYKMDYTEPINDFQHTIEKPKDKLAFIRELEVIKSKFSDWIEKFPENIDLKDSLGKYSLFADKIIKELKTQLMLSKNSDVSKDFIDDLIDYRREKMTNEELVDDGLRLAERIDSKLQKINERYDSIDAMKCDIPEEPKKTKKPMKNDLEEPQYKYLFTEEKTGKHIFADQYGKIYRMI